MSNETVTSEALIEKLQELGFSEGFENDVNTKEYDASAEVEELQKLVDSVEAEEGSEEKKDDKPEEKKEVTKNEVLEMTGKTLKELVKTKELKSDPTLKVYDLKRAIIQEIFNEDIGEEVIPPKKEKEVAKKEEPKADASGMVKIKLLGNVKSIGKKGEVLTTAYTPIIKRLIEIDVAEIVE